MDTTDTSASAVGSRLGLKIEEFGEGQTVLMLHGGGGPATLINYSQSLSKKFNVLFAVHPGFDGTEPPSNIASIKDLAKAYVRMLAEAKKQNVIVMGFSIGGWIAAEMAVLDSEFLAGLVFVDAVGITVPGETVLDVFSIEPGKIADFSFHQPDKFRIDMAAMPPERRAAMQANFAALAVYGRALNMQDPDLAMRLQSVKIPALVVWGESDRVVTPNYGRALSSALPASTFALIKECGHLPQLEQPAALTEVFLEFASQLSQD